MSINDILDTLIASATADKNTLDALIAQLQHTTITSSDDELYDAPTFNDATGIWTLAQSTANVGGLFVGCYKLPDNAINSFISSVTIVNFTAPASPTAPASVTVAGGSPVDLTDIADLEGQSFNSFCIRSTTQFEVTLRITESPAVAGCHMDLWTVYGATEVSRTSDTITVSTTGGGAHIAWSTGDLNIGCYISWDYPAPDWNAWPVGTMTPSWNYNTKNNLTWNTDWGGVPAGQIITFTFRNTPIP